MEFAEVAALRAATTYALRLGLFAGDPEVEDLTLRAIRQLNEEYDLPGETHDGWTFTRPIPAPPGETKARIVRIGSDTGGGFG